MKIKLPPMYESYTQYFNHIDYIFSKKYLIEANSISKQLLPVARQITKQLIQYIKQQCSITVYTGYHWDFNKQNFIKLDNKRNPYALWINLYKPVITDTKDGYTGRNIENENVYIAETTKITVSISLETNIKDLSGLIDHELQHVREMYAHPEKNVLALNKTNIYADPYLNKFVKASFRDILYMMSDTEQAAYIQQVYKYVKHHSEIKKIDVNDKNIEKLSHISLFYTAYSEIYNRKTYIALVPILQDVTLEFGYLLKTNFKYKNSNLSKQYINDVKNGNAEFDMNIFNDILEFIYSKIQLYQRKVANAIYTAISDNKKENPNDINVIINNNPIKKSDLLRKKYNKKNNK